MESTLSLPLTELTGEVGSFLGWGRNPSRWSEDKAKDVMECTASGLRRFYYQAMVSDKDSIHHWTFMKPVAKVQLASGASTAPLPEDFGGFMGMASVSRSGLDGGFWPLKQMHEEQIRVQYAAFPSITGRPVAYAESQIRGSTQTRSNRSELTVYPKADQDYTLSVPYYFLADYLTTANPYPYGGAAHAETMKAAVRAAAELFMDGQAGEQQANYLQCLAASIQNDRRHEPKSMGLNMDRSDDLLGFRGNQFPDGLWNPLGIGYLSVATYT